MFSLFITLLTTNLDLFAGSVPPRSNFMSISTINSDRLLTVESLVRLSARTQIPEDFADDKHIDAASCQKIYT
jgi:hypothetical protein